MAQSARTIYKDRMTQFGQRQKTRSTTGFDYSYLVVVCEDLQHEEQPPRRVRNRVTQRTYKESVEVLPLLPIPPSVKGVMRGMGSPRTAKLQAASCLFYDLF